MRISSWINLLVPAMLVLSACRAPDTPNMRVGSLPYPGPFTLFAAVDPDQLREHHYAPWSEFFVNEQSGGILYTCRAGFLDLSHIRDVIDLSRHYYLNFSDALLNGEQDVVVFAFSPCRYLVTFHLPEQWKPSEEATTLPAELDDAVVELSVQLAWIATSWYEFLQFFGYKSSGLIPEGRSAFTYDDIIAHAIGAEIARAALRSCNTENAFNETVTRELNRVLEELEVVSPEETVRAAELVEGKWWTSREGAIKRHLEVGLKDGTITPWVVRGLECCGDFEPESFDVPPLIDSLRPDGMPLATIEIELRLFEAGAIRSAVPGEPDRIVPHRDFPHLIEYLRSEFAKRYGPDFDQPYSHAD